MKNNENLIQSLEINGLLSQKLGEKDIYWIYFYMQSLQIAAFDEVTINLSSRMIVTFTDEGR